MRKKKALSSKKSRPLQTDKAYEAPRLVKYGKVKNLTQGFARSLSDGVARMP